MYFDFQTVNTYFAIVSLVMIERI